jgi:hypothetical protein
VLHLERTGHHKAALVQRTDFKLQGRHRKDRRRPEVTSPLSRPGSPSATR